MKAELRGMALGLMLLMIAELLAPTAAYALSSGPSQPEVQGFKPVGSTDMVNLFTGDFSYNIPLLDVEGYPVNLFYQGGVTMDQEASWVGLGWNVNPGVVERNLRGIPDDLAGEKIVREMHLRPNRTFGLSLGLAFELFGIDDASLGSLSVSASPSLNNYDGMRFETNVGLSLRSTYAGKSAFTAGLGLTSGSHSGLRLQPQVGFEAHQIVNGGSRYAGLNFGLSLSSREGMTNISFGLTGGVTGTKMANQAVSNRTSTSRSKSLNASFDLGTPTYTPQVSLPMDNFSASFNFTVGAEAVGAHANTRYGAFFSRQKLKYDRIETPAYGYLYLERGQSARGAMLDFNREKDGPYTADQASLSIANLTNDVFSVSGQGVSGSYRAYRAEVGNVFDAESSCSGASASGGVEAGFGAAAHGGADILINSLTSWSGKWGPYNEVNQALRYKQLPANSVAEKVFFREANEPIVDTDDALYNALGEDKPMRFTMAQVGGYDMRLKAQLDDGDDTPDHNVPSLNHRTKRDPRSQVFTYLTHREVVDDLGLFPTPARPSGYELTVPGDHMSEISVSTADGGRYVYGEPCYNMRQDDVTFAVAPNHEDATGTRVSYSSTDASTGNGQGRDEYYSRSITPPYAYSFLLTAALGPDYADVDGERGPSEGDLGGYTLFGYQYQTFDGAYYPWRTPATGAAGVAQLDRGLGATTDDDKGSYVYGEKEVQYLERIVTRNRIAIFELNDRDNDPRQDACGVKEDGSTDATKRLRFLKRITLYDRKAYEAWQEDGAPRPEAIKTVHFEYSYALCPGTPNSTADGQGKLTLTKLFFTYGRSSRGVTSPYVFNYGNVGSRLDNPAYEAAAQDRWGNVTVNKGGALFEEVNEDLGFGEEFDFDHRHIGTNEFPYAEQAEALADRLAGAWALRSIGLPSGGSIDVQYAADDYAFVQDRPAMRMFRVDQWGTGPTPTPNASQPNASESSGLKRLYFKIPEDLDVADATQFIAEGELLYFRSKVHFDWASNYADGDDFISGYACVESSGLEEIEDDDYAYVDLSFVRIDGDCGGCDQCDGPGASVNPIYRAALEQARLRYPQQLFSPPGFGDDANIGIQFITSMASSITGFITRIGNFFSGPNAEAAQNVSASIRMGDTWLRLLEPDHRKKGGGHRVERITVKDAWQDMETVAGVNASYTQHYIYGDENGSFGVAAYEPMIGADENPFRRPVYSKIDRVLSADERAYQEEPFGESLFPSPVVGYSRVIVEDEITDETTRNEQGTGRTVNDFYTARDFPTIVSRTGIKQVQRKSELNVFSLVGIRNVDNMHVSQGFTVETNDMHGKPKAVSVLPQGGDQAVSSITYTYKTDPNTGRLVNDATVIAPDGTVSPAVIGRHYEFLADTREFGSESRSGGASLNLELIYLGILLLPIPPILPKYSSESTRFRSAAFVKRIQRFGLLEKVTKMENGSVISTENIAYDARTGKVLLTRANNEYDDPVYTFEFPAYWHYKAMGPAYINAGMERDLSFDGSGVAVVQDAATYFTRGDELALWGLPLNGSTPMRCWVSAVSAGSITIMDDAGGPVFGTYRTKVIRSGFRNMQDLDMARIVALRDPLASLAGNDIDHVLKAEAMEYGDVWRTECACTPDPVTGAPNPYRDDRRGNWRLVQERTWLAERTRTLYNNNTDIRHDGVYASFSPFYKCFNGNWVKDPAGWTVVRTVTDYTPRGQALEDRDALGIYSSSTYTHHGMMVNSVAKNARMQETGFESFEAPYPSACTDRHFRVTSTDPDISTAYAHTGRKSVRVVAGSFVEMRSAVRVCPEADCGVSVQREDWEGGHLDLVVIGGAAPYVIDPQVIQGTVLFSPLTGGDQGLYVDPQTAGWVVRVVVTDAEGCRVVHDVSSGEAP